MKAQFVFSVCLAMHVCREIVEACVYVSVCACLFPRRSAVYFLASVAFFSADNKRSVKGSFS